MTATNVSIRATSLDSGDLREVLMGAQDNLTNVLAIVLGVSIGSGEVRLVAMAGLAAGLAEAISMGGVLYSATRAEHRVAGTTGRPVRAAIVCIAAALIAGLIPLVPFLSLPLDLAMVASLSVTDRHLRPRRLDRRADAQQLVARGRSPGPHRRPRRRRLGRGRHPPRRLSSRCAVSRGTCPRSSTGGPGRIPGSRRAGAPRS